MAQIARWFSGVIAVVILVGGAMVSQASAAPCNLVVVSEGLACDANAGTITYPAGGGDVRITALPNAAFFDSFLVLYHPAHLLIGDEALPVPLLFNHGAPSGPITINPSTLAGPFGGFAPGEELVFALYVDTDPDGTFTPAGPDSVITDAEYRVFMGARNVAIQNHVEPGTASPPFLIAQLVGFEDRLSGDPARDSDFNDHIFLFEGVERQQQTPNPGAIWLLGMGLIGLAIGGRYRTRR